MTTRSYGFHSRIDLPGRRFKADTSFFRNRAFKKLAAPMFPLPSPLYTSQMRHQAGTSRRSSYNNGNSLLAYNHQIYRPPFCGTMYATPAQPYGYASPPVPVRGIYPGYSYYQPQMLAHQQTPQAAYNWQQQPYSVMPYVPYQAPGYQLPPTHIQPPQSSHIKIPKDRSGRSIQSLGRARSRSAATKSEKDEVIRTWASSVSQTTKDSAEYNPPDAYPALDHSGRREGSHRRRDRERSRHASSSVSPEYFEEVDDESQMERQWYRAPAHWDVRQSHARDYRSSRRPSYSVYQKEAWGAFQD